MPTQTANFSYNKPLVNNATDADLWGGQLNTNWDDLDTDLALTTAVKSATSFNVGATEFNFTYLIDASSNNVTANLPAASTVFNGFVVRFKATDVTNVITIDGDSSETIDGMTTVTISGENDILEVVSNGTNWVINTQLNLPFGYISGLGTANNGSDSDHDIDISVGESADSQNITSIRLKTALTKQIDASFVAGTNQGGLASSLTLTADTWYHVFAIIVAGSTDVGFDTSIIAANLVTDHSATAFRYIGSVLTDSSANIIAFHQYGDVFYWDSPTLDFSASVSSTASSATIKTPLGFQHEAILTVGGSGGRTIYVSSLDQDDDAPSSTVAPLNSFDSPDGNRNSNPLKVITNTSSQVRIRANAGTDTQRIVTRGWEVKDWTQ